MTDEFKLEASALWRKLVQLHDGGAHTVLGYASWHSYCETEFALGRSQCYRLLEAGRVFEVVPQLGNEAQARELWPLLRDQGAPALQEFHARVCAEHEQPPTAAQLRQALAAENAPTCADLDRVPPRPRRPRSRRGEVYELGPHRLFCGATDASALTALFGDERAAMLWTDPPYGVDYHGKTEDTLTIANDTPAGLHDLLLGVWRDATAVLIESAPFYVAGPSGPNALAFLTSFGEAGYRYQQELVWVKNGIVIGGRNYQYQHESIFHGHGPGPNAGRTTIPRRLWYGRDNASTVQFVDASSASPDHPTMKPVELIRPHLLNSSRPGEIVLDPFAGSGSTMAAAHQTGRRAYMVEIDPGYCDVIRKRWKELHLDT